MRMSLVFAVGAVLSCGSTPGRAEVVYHTPGPFGGAFGLWGFDVFADQSVGQRFTPSRACDLTSLSLWFMNNDFDGATHAAVTVSLRSDHSDASGSIPGETIFETGTITVTAVGWDPQLETYTSAAHTRLVPGVNYWVVCESDSPAFVNGVWNIATDATGFMSNTDSQTGEWYPGGSGAVTCLVVEGTPVPLPGDTNGDCVVDLADLARLLSVFGGCEGNCEWADFNGDHQVDLADLAILLSNFGLTC